MLRYAIRQLQTPTIRRDDLLLLVRAPAPYLKGILDPTLTMPQARQGRRAVLFLPKPPLGKTLLTKLQENLPQEFIFEWFNPRCFRSTHDLQLMRHALHIAALAHKGQMRESGEPYLGHLVATARWLSLLEVDIDTLIACLLHDTVEDQTFVTLTDIHTEFGLQVMNMVDAVTKIGPSSKAAAENRAKLAMAINTDPRVGLLKLCDRWDNLLSLSALSPSRQLRIAEDTIQFFAPLAQQLGLPRLRHQLLRISNFYINLQYEKAASSG